MSSLARGSFLKQVDLLEGLNNAANYVCLNWKFCNYGECVLELYLMLWTSISAFQSQVRFSLDRNFILFLCLFEYLLFVVTDDYQKF